MHRKRRRIVAMSKRQKQHNFRKCMSCACQYFVAISLFYYYHTAPKKSDSGVSSIDLCSCNVRIPTCFTYTLESALWFLEWLNHVDTYVHEVRLWFECVFFSPNVIAIWPRNHMFELHGIDFVVIAVLLLLPKNRKTNGMIYFLCVITVKKRQVKR